MKGDGGSDDEGEVVVDGSVDADEDEVEESMTGCRRSELWPCIRCDEDRGIGTPIAAGAAVVIIDVRGATGWGWMGMGVAPVARFGGLEVRRGSEGAGPNVRTEIFLEGALRR